MYYSRQNQRNKNASGKNYNAPQTSTWDYYRNEYASLTPEERDNSELGAICLAMVVLFFIVLFSIVAQVKGNHELGWLFWLCVFLFSYSIYSFKNKLNTIKVRRGLTQERSTISKLTVSNVPECFLLKDKDAEIKRIISERESILQQKCDIEMKITELKSKLIKTKTVKTKIEELIGEKERLEKELNEKICKVTWKCTSKYKSFEQSMEYLRHVKAVIRRGELGDSNISSLFIQCKYIEEKNGFIEFGPKPVCMEISDNWFCITSDAIYCFDKGTGAYKGCVGTEEYRITRTTEEWTEKVPYTTWTYRRVDGGPDRRYKNNPMTTCYSEYHRSSSNVICIRILDKRISYQVEPSERDYIMKHKSNFEPA
ncbi:hypothetical protein [Butyrivibrio sp. FCS014]|uniref:hypothetical protein n=1 Tax=Butyrivibrio sp. FCS014 TaxID=1408304 RepID=UPI0004643896|nr:hypothetical protein [Butyrivibrio sp. FCS014]